MNFESTFCGFADGRDCAPQRCRANHGFWEDASTTCSLRSSPIVFRALEGKLTANNAFRRFVEVIVFGDTEAAIALLDASPLLARESAAHGATRQDAKQHFFTRLRHYIHEGDSVLRKHAERMICMV